MGHPRYPTRVHKATSSAADATAFAIRGAQVVARHGGAMSTGRGRFPGPSGRPWRSPVGPLAIERLSVPSRLAWTPAPRPDVPGPHGSAHPAPAAMPESQSRVRHIPMGRTARAHWPKPPCTPAWRRPLPTRQYQPHGRTRHPACSSSVPKPPKCGPKNIQQRRLGWLDPCARARVGHTTGTQTVATTRLRCRHLAPGASSGASPQPVTSTCTLLAMRVTDPVTSGCAPWSVSPE